jgi:uncharacterized membrane protein YjfL (UPF0719 family)
VVQLLASIVIAVAALYLGFWVFKKITRDIDEIRELVQGNVAVGVLVAAIFLAVALVVQAGVQKIALGLGEAASEGLFTPSGVIDIAITLLQLVLGILLSVASIYFALRLFDRYSGFFGTFDETVKGNVAVAIVLAGMILGIALIIHGGVLGIITVLH